MHDPSDARRVPPGTRDSLRGLFSNRNFAFYVGVRVATLLGQSIQAAAIMWQAYETTDSPIALAFVGIIRFVPSMAISLLAGAITDTGDRRKLLALSQIVPLLTSAVLAALTIAGTITLTPIYASVLLLGISGAFEGPSRQTIL